MKKRNCKEIAAHQIFELIGGGVDLDPAACHVLTPMPSDDGSGVVICFLVAKVLDSETPLELIVNIPTDLFGESS
ncbi:MAG: hypothetical protein WCO71_08290 [Pseudomonadota bacterium]